jgi:recombination protein RecA
MAGGRAWVRGPNEGTTGRAGSGPVRPRSIVMSIDIDSKNRSIKTVINSIEKQFGRGAIMALGSAEGGADVAVIPTGSLALDDALGIGGYPRGRISEIYGPESSGKTTLSLHAIREAMKSGAVAAFIDAEHAFDLAYARSIGIDTERLLVSQPDNGEQALEIVDMLTRSGAVDLVVVDSVAALTPKAEIEGEMGDAHAGLQARLMSQALRKLTAVASRTETAILFTNQLRHRTGIVFGNPETTTGGNALKFYASVRLDVRRLGAVKDGDATVGSRTRVRVVKNKMAVPFKEAEFDIRWGVGIDAAGDLLDHAIQLGVVEKTGTYYAFAGEHLGQGRERARERLRDEVIATAVRTAVKAASREARATEARSR